MNKKKLVSVLIVIIIVAAGGFFFLRKGKTAVQQIDLSKKPTGRSAITGNVSPISGLACDNWDKRSVAVMQPSDVTARPAAGFSEADMVIEMPAFTASTTRLMGIYLCNIPKEIGAIRSSRHDYIALAAGLDSVFIHWGGSHFALELLKQNIIDHMDCLTGSKYCFRWDWKNDPKMRMEDSGYVTSDSISQVMTDMNFRTTNNFAGYPHQEEAPLDQRPSGGHLRVAFAKPDDVEYDYDKETNTWLRTWADVADTDRNNGQRLAPKNVVVIFAKSEQIRLADESRYISEGLMDPWSLIPKEDQKGIDDIPGAPGIGRYNNVEIGDPWFDNTDSGEAYYYMNGQQTKGTWKKDRSKLDSKMTFYDESGAEVQFIPGQIWLEILEPGQALKWVPAN